MSVLYTHNKESNPTKNFFRNACILNANLINGYKVSIYSLLLINVLTNQNFPAR